MRHGDGVHPGALDCFARGACRARAQQRPRRQGLRALSLHRRARSGRGLPPRRRSRIERLARDLCRFGRDHRDGAARRALSEARAVNRRPRRETHRHSGAGLDRACEEASGLGAETFMAQQQFIPIRGAGRASRTRQTGESMNWMKTASLAILALLAAALVALAPATALAQDKPKIPLRVGTLRIAAQTDAWVAQKRGFFAKHGIEAALTPFNTGAESIPAMQGGAIGVLLSIPGIGMIAMERGLDLVPVFQDESAHDAPPDSASVQVLEASPIKTLADLRGKKIGVGGLSTQNTIAVKMLLDKAGVDPASVQMSEVPFPAMMNA